MARNFNGSNQFLRNLNAVLTSAPISFACWFYPVDLAADNCLICITDISENLDYLALIARNTATYSNTVYLQSRSTEDGIGDAITTAAFSTGSWQHFAGVEASTTDRRVYLDGGNKGTGSDDITLAGLNNTAIGRLDRAAPAIYTSGRVAEVAIWNAALTDAEVIVLAAGISPLAVRPQSLVTYWPLMGNLAPEPDWLENKYSMTLYNGTTKADHQPIMYPVSPQIALIGGVAPVLLNHSPSNLAAYKTGVRILTP